MIRKFISIILLFSLPLGVFAAPKKRVPVINVDELIDEAIEAFDSYNPQLVLEITSKLRKAKDLGDYGDLVESLESRAERMESMMQRVDAVEVIDSITVSRENFFNNYRLSSAAGYILNPSDLNFINAKPNSTVYMTEGCNTMIWSGDDGLVESHMLTDGTWEEPNLLIDGLSIGGVANYPFLMPDGVTLYYAADCLDSFGGYDIFVSRRNGETFASPQNLGMPYNSPYNDFMLVIDEETGVGWFASDRNSPDEDVTIYIFVPSETRVNVDVDDPNLATRAKLSDISLTQSDNDYSALLYRIKQNEPSSGIADNTPDFEFIMPDGRILTRWDQLSNERSRRLMETYIDALADFKAEGENLEKSRQQFGQGSKSAASAILKAEKKIRTSEEQLKSLSNRIIEAEKIK